VPSENKNSVVGVDTDMRAAPGFLLWGHAL
jgi:hypothetical protein